MIYKSAKSVTPDDSNDLDIAPTKAVYVGSSGDLEVTFEAMEDGDSIVLTSMPVGVHKLSVKRILSTNTTASSIVALY